MDSDEVRRRWAERVGEFSPEYYAYHGPNETSRLLRRLLERYVGREAAVLELGCSSGRHLSHLLDWGFEDLTGIDVNEDAFAVMADSYPDLAARGTFHVDAIENVVGEFVEDRFDAVYSVETLQHVHPDAEWVFGELARITGDLLVTVENEGGNSAADVNYVNDEVPLYYRDWNRVFTDLGLVEVESRETERDTVRVFRLSEAG